MERTMTQRWMGLIAVVGLIPLLLAMRPVDEALLAAASKGDLGEQGFIHWSHGQE